MHACMHVSHKSKTGKHGFKYTVAYNIWCPGTQRVPNDIVNNPDHESYTILHNIKFLLPIGKVSSSHVQ